MRSLEHFTSRLDRYEQRLSAAVHSLQNVKALETAAQRLAQLQQRLLLGYSTLHNKVHTASNTCYNLELRLQEAMSQHLAWAQRSWQQNYQALQLNYEQHLQPQLLQHRKNALHALMQRLEQNMQWHLQQSFENISNQEKLLLQHAFSDLINAANQRWFNSMRSLEHFTSRLDRYEQRLSAAVHSLQNVKALETAAQRLAQLQQRLLLGYSTLHNKVHTASNTCYNLELRLQEAMSQHLAWAQRSWQQNYQALQLNYEQHLQPQLRQMQTKETLLYSKLLQLNPFYQLDHGWSLTTIDGKHSVAAADLSEGSEIITLLKGAEVHSTVTQIIPKEHVAREESVAVATTSGDEGGDDKAAAPPALKQGCSCAAFGVTNLEVMSKVDVLSTKRLVTPKYEPKTADRTTPAT